MGIPKFGMHQKRNLMRYCRDWRTDGRCIYLVLWFGDVRGKNLPARQNGSVMPSSPNELREALVMSLSEGERSRIEIVVLDVSRSGI